MERALQKMARQLNQYDAASLASLWEHYAQIVSRFEPTKRWEEAVLSFCMIQAVHWKNQLFNSEWLEGRNRVMQDKELERQLRSRLEALSTPSAPNAQSRAGAFEKRGDRAGAAQAGGRKSVTGGEKQKRRKVLIFPAGRDGGQP